MEEAPTITDSVRNEVRLQDDAGRKFILIASGAIGLDSSADTSRVIDQEEADSVCVDLDPARVKILKDESKWESLSIREVVREKLATALLLNLLLSAYSRKLDESSAVLPGAEQHKALQVAEEKAIPVTLVERDLHITYNRAWQTLSYRGKFHLLVMAIRRLFRYKKLSDEAANDLSQTDVLSAFVDEVTRLQPVLKETLVDERDQYTIRKMMAAPGDRIVAFVGAGRLPSLHQLFREKVLSSLPELESVPEMSPAKKWARRILPLLLLAAILYISWHQGSEFIRENLRFWILANSLFTGLGAILAGAHIVAIIVAILVAPISPLIPAGPGTVAAIVQAVIRPPLVRDFQTFADDVTHLRNWRKNRILRVILVMILCGLGSIIGTFLGTSRIILSFLGLR